MCLRFFFLVAKSAEQNKMTLRVIHHYSLLCRPESAEFQVVPRGEATTTVATTTTTTKRSSAFTNVRLRVILQVYQNSKNSELQNHRESLFHGHW